MTGPYSDFIGCSNFYPLGCRYTERAWPWKDGKTITFGARLYAYSRRHRLVFGTNTQGWNDVRAEIELESILQQVERGIADQIGHTSAAFTLQVYQQTRNRRLTDRERQAIWELMRFADEPERCPLVHRAEAENEDEFRPINGTMAEFERSGDEEEYTPAGA